jgi:hypothetical protein
MATTPTHSVPAAGNKLQPHPGVLPSAAQLFFMQFPQYRRIGVFMFGPFKGPNICTDHVDERRRQASCQELDAGVHFTHKGLSLAPPSHPFCFNFRHPPPSPPRPPPRPHLPRHRALPRPPEQALPAPPDPPPHLTPAASAADAADGESVERSHT